MGSAWFPDAAGDRRLYSPDVEACSMVFTSLLSVRAVFLGRIAGGCIG